MNTISIAALALVSVACSVGCGSTTPSTPPATAKATASTPPPAEAQRLASRLVGQWKGHGTMTMDGKPMPVDFDISCTTSASAWAVTCQARGLDPAGKLHEETHLWGYNAETSKLHFFCVTSDGEVHDHVGGFTDKGIAVEYTGTLEGKPMVEAISFEPTDGSTVHFHNDMTVGGAPFLGLDLTFKR
jgi:hypothetical protein